MSLLHKPINRPSPPDLRDRILERLGFERSPSTDLDGLRAVYRAWCMNIPFDNVRKLIALADGGDRQLPGGDAVEFFEYWLDHGSGGTCWATSNALFELVWSLGFDARRVAGSMRDMGFPNHGSVKVMIDGHDWLVDSSMLTNEPIPLGDELYANGDMVFGVEVEPVGGSHLVWFDVPPHPDYFPCRLQIDPTDHAFVLDAYEKSRHRGPFNQHVYARRNQADSKVVLRGPTRYYKTRDGVEQRDLTPDEVLSTLRHDIGISDELIETWVAAGGLTATFQPPSEPPPPPITIRRPSLRY